MPVVASLANASAGGFGFNKPQGGLEYLWLTTGQDTGNNYYFLTSSSTTGATGTWTARTSSFGTNFIFDVASNGKNLYVAVGTAGTLATSPDGITWTQRTSSFGTSTITNVAYGSDGYWVAVGDAGKLATSTDGITWTQRTSGITSNINVVAYGASLWIYGGSSSGTMRTATDPTGTWTSRTSTISDGIEYVYYWPEQLTWVAGAETGTTGALASSTNGTTWTARNSAISDAGIGVASNSTNMVTGWYDLFSGKYKVQKSTNGTSWTQTVGGSTGSNGILYSFSSDNLGTLAMIAGGGNAFTSTDGSTWTDRGAISASVSGETIYPSFPALLFHSSGLPSIRQ